MKFEEFINKYDFEGSIVLLEGKRYVLESEKDNLIAFGYKIAKQSKHLKVRSGNADGADYYFVKVLLKLLKIDLK